MQENKNQIRPKFNWKVFLKMAEQDATIGELCSELIDNPIPKGDSSVNVKLEIFKGSRPEESYIKVTDDGIGISRSVLPQIFEIGESPSKDKLLLSEMGIGMKLALFGLGRPEYIASKEYCSNSGECSEYVCKPHFHSGIPFYGNDLVQFNVEKPDTNEITTDSGTVIKVNECDEQIPNWTDTQFKKWVANFEAIYVEFLGKRLELEITYTNDRRKLKQTYSAICKSYHPVLTNPYKILKPFVDFGLGANELVINDEIIKVDEYPDMIIRLSAGYKAHPSQLIQAFKITKNPLYNVEDNVLSPYSYFSKESGIILKKRGKVLNFGSNLEVKSSREASHYITLEVEGIPSTGLKKELKRGNRRDAMLKAVIERLRKEEFYIRHTAGSGARSEKDDQEKFVEYLNNSPELYTKYGVTNPNQISTFVRNGVGESDIVIWDTDKKNVIAVGEVKKDRPNAETARQLFGYMAYYLNTNPNGTLPVGFVVCQNEQQATFTHQVQSFKSVSSDTVIDYYNSNKLYI